MMPESSAVLLVWWLAPANATCASAVMTGPNITWHTPRGEKAMASLASVVLPSMLWVPGALEVLFIGASKFLGF